MNNDYKAFQANHSSMSSNKPIANKTQFNYNKAISQRNKYLNKDSNNNNNSPYKKNNKFTRGIKYPYNKGPLNSPYEDEIITGYYVNPGDEPRTRSENGGEEELEDNKDIIEIRERRDNLIEEDIGDGEFVRYEISNENNEYSPNQNGQDVYAYQNLRNINNNSNNKNMNRGYHLPKDNQEEFEEEDNEEYYLQTPDKNIEDNFRSTNYNNFNNNQVYKKRRILGNLRDSVSSEAYANKSMSRATLTDYRNSGIYIKPKTTYNNNIKNGISPEERGIESLKDSNQKVSYDENYEIIEESPIYNYPKNQQQEKGGKIDLNLGLSKLKDAIKNKTKEKYDMIWYENNLDKIVKIQATYRYYRVKKVMDKYHDIDEFIFHISKVQFNHFYDNFFFFINQLFKAYEANALGGLDLDNNEEKEENEEENNEESDYEENKSYDQLLNDYTNLKKKYDELMKNRNDNNTNNNNSKLSYKKINPELASLPGETTFGSIKTDTHKLYKFKASFQNNNNSTSNIKDNLTISNYNDEDNNERHYYTPDHYYDEDSFNDNKDKRYSYSSIHSDEYSKYFDNEQPKHKFKSLNTKKTKGITLDKTKKNKVFEYSPSIEIDRENSIKKNESQNERINNISVINLNRSGIDEQEDIFDKKRIEEIAYDKYIINYSKDLRIVKNNKIVLKSDKEELDKKNFDSKYIFKQKENIIELKAKKKTDEQKMKEIFNNKRLYEKIKSKLEKDNEKFRHTNIIDEEKKIEPNNNKDNRYKLLLKLKKANETYLTIKKEKQKQKIGTLKESNENNFEIKSEYYYIETKDSILPEIIEKKIQESNKINQINKENQFKENKTVLSSGTNFNIKGKDHKYIENIESNELTILNKTKKIKKKNVIKKNENIIFHSQPKKWNLSKDLNPIINEEFSLKKEDNKEQNDIDKKDKENILYIENNELQVIDNIGKKRKKEKNINKFDKIEPTKNQELAINKGKIFTKERQLFKSNENSINIKPIKKKNVREIKITTKKILKQEKIISRKKFLKTQYTSENSILLKGNKTSKINYEIRKNEEFKIKNKKKKTKEEETQIKELDNKKIFDNIKIEELDEINIESKNEAFLNEYIEDINKKQNNEKIYSVIASNQIQLNSENKEGNKFNNLNIGKNVENEIIIKNENKDILRAKKKKEPKFEIRQNLIEQFTFKGNKKDEKRIFINLDIKKCEGQEIKAVKKEPIKLEKISNENLTIIQEEKDIKELEIQVGNDLINNNLVFNNDIKYKINPKKKEENIIVKNKSINIRNNNKANSDLIIVKQKRLNLSNNQKKIFKKENIEPCYSETITIKTRETYEEPRPNYKLSRKFSKFLFSENENIQNDINLIKPLSETNEAQFEIIGNKNIQIRKEINEENEYKEKPIIENKINNHDFKKSLTKQFINNMVQNKLDIEKKKTMDNTKNKLVIIYKTMKMKNALMKNTKNKKEFLNALKNIKNKKLNSLIKSNTFDYNYMPIHKTKTEEYTDTIDLKNKIQNNQLYIEKNIIEIKHKKRIKKYLTEIKENYINIEGIKNNSFNNKVEKVDKEIQMSPKKEVKIKTKKIFKKETPIKKHFLNMLNTKLDSFSYQSEINLKTKEYVDIETQTPKLRPKNESSKSFIFNKTMIQNEKSLLNKSEYEINHNPDITYLGINNYENKSDNNIKIEKEEDIKDNDKLYRISQFMNLFKYFFDSNKKISFLKLLYLTKWIHLTKNFDLNKSKQKQNKKDIKTIFNKSKIILVFKLKDFYKKYKTEKATNLMMNLFNRRKKEIMKIIKKKKKGKKKDGNLLRKNKLALNKIKSELRKHCGRYVFSLYKKNK